jgi:predicted nucleotide-binding protein
MKRDRNLYQELLLKLDSLPLRLGEMAVLTGQEPELAVDEYTPDEITYHLEFLKADGLIDSPGSQPAIGVTFRGLSSLGHDLVEKIRDSTAPQEKVRNDNPMAQASLRALRMKRDDARLRLKQRIDEAKAVIPGRIASPEDLSSAEEMEKKWRAYNRELLLRMFTTDEYASDYDGSKIAIHRREDRYEKPDLNTLALRLSESVRRQVARLESIIDRLELIDEADAGRGGVSVPKDYSKVFVVHGHDEGSREAVGRFIQTLGFEPIILHERAKEGRTVIEKVEAHGDVGFAVVLLTPDDEGCAKDGTPAPRARQNVLLELGYFIGRLGRNRVCALKRGEVELPSDFGGVVYEVFDATGGWKQKLGRELEAVGYAIDWNTVMRP